MIKDLVGFLELRLHRDCSVLDPRQAATKITSTHIPSETGTASHSRPKTAQAWKCINPGFGFSAAKTSLTSLLDVIPERVFCRVSFRMSYTSWNPCATHPIRVLIDSSLMDFPPGNLHCQRFDIAVGRCAIGNEGVLGGTLSLLRYRKVHYTN